MVFRLTLHVIQRFGFDELADAVVDQAAVVTHAYH